MWPILKLLGISMIACGITLNWFGLNAQRLYMDIIVRVAVITTNLLLLYRLRYFEVIDPTVINTLYDPTIGWILLFAAFPIIFLT